MTKATKTSKAKTAKRDLMQEITDRVIEALENGAAPWVKPWKDSAKATDFSMPHNASSGRAYNGINVLLLWSAAQSKGYTTQGWMTYKQAESLGGQVRKGEKATGIVFWNFFKKEEEDKNGKKKIVKIPYLKEYKVFNVDQIDGLEKTFKPEPLEMPKGGFIEVYKALEVNYSIKGNRAYFTPSADTITLPNHKQFKTRDDFEATAAHELVHWTGHADRLTRDFSGRFGDESYAFEELIAEMGSAFLCGTFGLPIEKLQHTEYVIGWLKVLKNDKYAIFTASTAAKTAAEYVLENAGLVEFETHEDEEAEQAAA